MAPPGYPKTVVTPCLTSDSQIRCAPVRTIRCPHPPTQTEKRPSPSRIRRDVALRREPGPGSEAGSNGRRWRNGESLRDHGVPQQAAQHLSNEPGRAQANHVDRVERRLTIVVLLIERND